MPQARARRQPSLATVCKFEFFELKGAKFAHRRLQQRCDAALVKGTQPSFNPTKQ
jgi:hypothetical protein